MMRLALPLLALIAGCAGPSNNYSRSVNGTVGGYSMKNVQSTPANLMVARKIQTPLYIVIDANRIKDTWPLETAACATGAPGCARFNLMDFHEFVRRDLRASMTNYFTRVEVVDSTQPLPNTPHIVADVKVDNIRLHALVRGFLTYQLIEMTWGFAMRRSDQQEYAYSFAGTATSNDSYPTFEAGCGQLVENAIPAMLKQWTEGKSFDALRGSSSDAPPRGGKPVPQSGI